MSILKTVEHITPFQQLLMATLAVFASFSVGYNASDLSQPQTIEEQFADFDQFAYKAQDEVNPLMQEVLENPTEDNLRNANNHLKIGVKNWESQETGENKELFHEYRLACQDVVDSIQEEESNAITESKIEKMNELYLELI